MKCFFDTSVLVAVFLGDHPAHDRALGRFLEATKESSFCALHSLAEVYSVVTRLPVRPAISGDQAWLFLENLRERLAVVALSERDYFKAIAEAAAAGVTGGRIYDALILRAAKKCAPETIYTLNLRDFSRLAPDLADRIRTP